MGGTVAGGKKAAETNMKRYGADFYRRQGSIGGRKGRTGGFASAEVDANGMTGRERAKVAGALGGRISRRTKADPYKTTRRVH